METRSALLKTASSILALAIGLFSQMPIVHAGVFQTVFPDHGLADSANPEIRHRNAGHSDEPVPASASHCHSEASPTSSDVPAAPDSGTEHCLKIVSELEIPRSDTGKSAFSGGCVPVNPVWADFDVPAPSPVEIRFPSPPENRATAFVKENRRRI